MTIVPDEPLCDVRAVGKLLSVSKRTVWRLVSEGKLHPIRISSKIVRFAVQEVRILMQPEQQTKKGNFYDPKGG
jgi:predicted DNA-binding transcriptional regulator AlpA